MKLFPPVANLRPYFDGFKDKDLLNRSATGQKLSDLVEKIEDPMVIALDGAWGSGKSFFLKCWVGAHTQEFKDPDGNAYTAKTVYVDAFKNDYLDDPLIALTKEIAERFKEDKQTKRP